MRTGAAEIDDRGPSDRSEEAWIHKIDLDHADRPVIAASGFKGVLRALLAERCAPQHYGTVKRLFGFAVPKNTLDDIAAPIGNAGRAEFRNAVCIEGGGLPTRRGMVRMDRGTGSAADARLRHQLLADGGLRFAVSILLDGVGEEDVAFLVAALRLIDGSAATAIGGSTRQGFGRIAWCRDDETIRHLDSAEIAAWLDGKGDADWRKRGDLSHARLQQFERAVGAVDLVQKSKCLVLDVKLAFDGFFLVSDAKEKKKSDAPGLSNIRPLGTGDAATAGRPLLPGSATKGPLRAQAERIWRTMTSDMSDTCDIVDELFGNEKRAGAVRCSDFVGSKTKIRRHEMVAIDRFTGGGAEKLKFSHAVFEAPTLSGDITLDLERVFDDALNGKPPSSAFAMPTSEAAIGLFAMVLRDLAEGDIAFGFGTRKGYGRVASVRSGDTEVVRAFARLLGGDESLRRAVDACRAKAAASTETRARKEA